MPDANPFETARRDCLRRGGDWTAELEAYLSNGYVVSRPDLFVMARDCPRGADLSDPQRSWPRAECDSVFIWQAVGDPRELLKLLPWRPSYLGWYRQGRGWRRDHWLPLKRFESALAKFYPF